MKMKNLCDLHTHTTASGHAYNTLYEMARAGAEAGLSIFGSSDHAPAMPGTCSEMYFCNFSVIPRELFGVRLLMGCELNIIDFQGTVDLAPWLLERLDYGIASIHDLCFPIGTTEENTAAAIGAMKNPFVQIIGHPDSASIPLDYEAVVRAAKENHVLLEVNNSSLKPGSPRPGARENYLTMLELCRRCGTPIIVNSDAHCAADAGNQRFAFELLQETDFPPELVANYSRKLLQDYLERAEL